MGIPIAEGLRLRFWELVSHILFVLWRSALEHVEYLHSDEYGLDDGECYEPTSMIGRPWWRWLMRGEPKQPVATYERLPQQWSAVSWSDRKSDHEWDAPVITEGKLITEATLANVLIPYEPGDGISGDMVADENAGWGWSWVMTPEEAAPILAARERECGAYD